MPLHFGFNDFTMLPSTVIFSICKTIVFIPLMSFFFSLTFPACYRTYMVNSIMLFLSVLVHLMLLLWFINCLSYSSHSCVQK